MQQGKHLFTSTHSFSD